MNLSNSPEVGIKPEPPLGVNLAEYIKLRHEFHATMHMLVQGIEDQISFLSGVKLPTRLSDPQAGVDSLPAILATLSNNDHDLYTRINDIAGILRMHVMGGRDK